jgi:hypothetical protein
VVTLSATDSAGHQTNVTQTVNLPVYTGPACPVLTNPLDPWIIVGGLAAAAVIVLGVAIFLRRKRRAPPPPPPLNPM